MMLRLYVTSLIKGGKGSGFYRSKGHKGRMGHIGGSVTARMGELLDTYEKLSVQKEKKIETAKKEAEKYGRMYDDIFSSLSNLHRELNTPGISSDYAGLVKSQIAELERRSKENEQAYYDSSEKYMKLMKYDSGKEQPLIQQKKPQKISYLLEDDFSEEEKKEIQDGVGFISSLIPDSGDPYYEPRLSFRYAENDDRFPKLKGRSYYDATTNTVFLRKKSGAATVVHEMGHWLEWQNPELVKTSIDFLNKRTQGETPRMLSEITGDSGYNDDEIVKADNFFDPYCGKVYKNSASEILSMGLQQIYQWGASTLYSKDKEYFAYVLGSVNAFAK